MEIDIAIPSTDLDSITRITLLEQIAVAAAREADGGPSEAVMTLMAAAAVVALGNGGKLTDITEMIPTAIEAAQKILNARMDDGQDSINLDVDIDVNTTSRRASVHS
jgi:hypothetical protein